MSISTCTHTFTDTDWCVQSQTCTTQKKQKNSLTSVNWQVINFMMQNQNTRDEDGEKKNCVVCNCVCPDPSKNHPLSPLRNLCLCILKSFCCGCYCCCFQSTETPQISEEVERFLTGSFFVVWFITDQKSELRPQSSVTLRWTNAVIFLSERFVIWTVTHLYVEALLRESKLLPGQKCLSTAACAPQFFFFF